MASGRGLRWKCPHPREGDSLGLSGTEVASSQHTRVIRRTQGSHTQSKWTFIRESACEHAEQGRAVGSTHFLRRRVTVSAGGGTGRRRCPRPALRQQRDSAIEIRHTDATRGAHGAHTPALHVNKP